MRSCVCHLAGVFFVNLSEDIDHLFLHSPFPYFIWQNYFLLFLKFRERLQRDGRISQKFNDSFFAIREG